MKALEIIIGSKNNVTYLLQSGKLNSDENKKYENRLKFINEAIKELEQIQDRILQLETDETDKIVQDIMLEKDEALAIERLMYKKLLEKNKELSDQLALNNPFENRSCDNCKHFKTSFKMEMKISHLDDAKRLEFEEEIRKLINRFEELER